MEPVDDLKASRLVKLEHLRKKGIRPYGQKFPDIEPVSQVLGNFQEGRHVVVAGRIMANRKHGKVYFLDLMDQTGKVQLFVKADNISAELFELIGDLDIGDIIGVKGELFTTKTGQQSIRVGDVTILSKSLLSLPEKWHGLKDVEIRYRQRYVDMISNAAVKDVFIKRSRIVSMIRNYLDQRGFLEVETPMLQPMAGGARGRPFKSKHNA